MSWLLDCLVVILIALLFGFLVRYAVMLPALLFGFLARYAVILTALLFGFLARYAVILTALLFSFLVRYAVILTALLFVFLARYAVILTALFGFLARYADCLSNTTCLWMPLPSFASILTSSRTVSAFLNWHLNTALGCPDSKCFFLLLRRAGCVCGGREGGLCVCVFVCMPLCGVCVCVCVCVLLWFCLHVYVSCLVIMSMVLLWWGGLCPQVSVVWRPVWWGHQAGTDSHPDSTPRLLLPAGSQPRHLPQTALLWPLCGGSCMLITNHVSDVKCFRVYELWMILWKSTGEPQCIAVVMW